MLWAYIQKKTHKEYLMQNIVFTASRMSFNIQTYLHVKP